MIAARYTGSALTLRTSEPVTDKADPFRLANTHVACVAYTIESPVGSCTHFGPVVAGGQNILLPLAGTGLAFRVAYVDGPFGHDPSGLSALQDRYVRLAAGGFAPQAYDVVELYGMARSAAGEREIRYGLCVERLDASMVDIMEVWRSLGLPESPTCRNAVEELWRHRGKLAFTLQQFVGLARHLCATDVRSWAADEAGTFWTKSGIVSADRALHNLVVTPSGLKAVDLDR